MSDTMHYDTGSGDQVQPACGKQITNTVQWFARHWAQVTCKHCLRSAHRRERFQRVMVARQARLAEAQA